MRRDTPEPSSTRRDFLRGAGRCAALAAVAAVALLAARDGECVNNGRCDGCRVFDRCELPPARASRFAKRTPETR
jgi:hypothetical protein